MQRFVAGRSLVVMYCSKQKTAELIRSIPKNRMVFRSLRNISALNPAWTELNTIRTLLCRKKRFRLLVGRNRSNFCFFRNNSMFLGFSGIPKIQNFLIFGIFGKEQKQKQFLFLVGRNRNNSCFCVFRNLEIDYKKEETETISSYNLKKKKRTCVFVQNGAIGDDTLVATHATPDAGVTCISKTIGTRHNQHTTMILFQVCKKKLFLFRLF